MKRLSTFLLIAAFASSAYGQAPTFAEGDFRLAKKAAAGLLDMPVKLTPSASSLWAFDASGNLVLIPQSTFQAFSANLSEFAAVNPSANGLSLIGAANYAAMITLLSPNLAEFAGVNPSANGLSLIGATDYAAMLSLLDAQPHSSVLDTYAGINPSANVQTLLGTSSYAEMRALFLSMLGSVDNALLAADGTGGSTPKPRDITVENAATATANSVGFTNAHAGQTNSSFRISPKGNGAFYLGPVMDGTSAGGNARGTKAVDLQMSRSAATQVASGAGSFVTGAFNTASGDYVAVFGYENSVTNGPSFTAGTLNVVSGQFASALGWTNTSGGHSSIAFGRQNTASASQSIAIGHTNNVSGTVGVGLGYQNVVSGNYAAGIGYSNDVTQTGAVGLGYDNTASATYAIAVGKSNTSSGSASFTSGDTNTASATNSAAEGNQAEAKIEGEAAFANGRFTALGDAQVSEHVLRCATTDATVGVEMFTGASGNQRLVLDDDSTWSFYILVTARRTNTDGTSAVYTATGGIDRNSGAGTTALVAAVTPTAVEDNASYNFVVSADTTNGSLKLAVTGVAAHNVQWVAWVRVVKTKG